jgi:hypothetical protein
MIDTSAIAPFREVRDGQLLAYRLWRMMDDVIDHLTVESDRAGIDGIYWRDVPRVEAALSHPGRFDTADEFVVHVISSAVPRAAERIFAARMTRPGDFLARSAALRSADECRACPSSSSDSEDGGSDDLLCDLLSSHGMLYYDTIPVDVLGFVVEGWLRLRLEAALHVDQELHSGYSVRFTARAFAEWFRDELLPAAVADML